MTVSTGRETVIDDLTLNELMDRNPLDLTQDDLERLVNYFREARAAGPRPKKETGPTAKLDLSTLGLKAPKPTGPQIKRRF